MEQPWRTKVESELFRVVTTETAALSILEKSKTLVVTQSFSYLRIDSMLNYNQIGLPTTETNYVVFTTLVALVCKSIAVILDQKPQSFSCMHNVAMPLDKESLSDFCQASYQWVVYLEKGTFNEQLAKDAMTINYDYIK